MEQYEILQRLGYGSQGEVYQVRHKRTSKTYALKSIQCCDEKQANNALDEAKALMKLKHPNICIHHDHFLKFDQERKTFDVCIIMDCFTDGDLQRVLSMKRAAKTNLDEILVKKWIGQLVNLLAYIHDKKIIHRDLKSSNIFVSSSMDLVIGDFGVAAEDNEVRTHANTCTGTYPWMAPEQRSGIAYDSRCDVWALGCVLIELLTCRHFADQDIPQVLISLETDPEPLLSHIAKDYSKSMSDFVRTLLVVDPNSRPYSRDLKKTPFVKDCSKLLSISGEESSGDSSADFYESIPTAGGPKAVVTFLNQQKPTGKVLAAALDWLANQPNLQFDNSAERTIIDILRTQLNDEEICVPATALFAAATKRVRKESMLHTSAVVKPMLQASANHSLSLQIQTSVAEYQANVGDYEGGPQLLAAHDGVALLITALKSFHTDAQLVEAATRALFGLFSEAETATARVGVQFGVLDVLFRCWIIHKAHPKVLAAISSALLGLCCEDAILEAAEGFDLCCRISCALADFPDHKDFVRFALKLLASLMEDETLAINFLTLKNAPEGIHQLSRVATKHRNTIEVLEPLIFALNNITSHESNLTHEQRVEMKSIAQNIMKEFSSKQEVKNACDQVISILSRR